MENFHDLSRCHQRNCDCTEGFNEWSSFSPRPTAGFRTPSIFEVSLQTREGSFSFRRCWLGQAR